MTLKVLSTLAVQAALPSLIKRYESSAGIGVACDFAPTNALLARIAAGDQADAAILTRAGLDALAAQDAVLPGSIADIAVSEVGIAVRAGASKPDIGTIDALKAALLAAKSICYSKIGASGVFFAALIQRLGIAEAINAKAVIIPSGFTGELVARGEADLAVQQLSELLMVRGVDIVGPLPAGGESVTMIAAGVLTCAAQPALAQRFVAELRSARSQRALSAGGLRAVE